MLSGGVLTRLNRLSNIPRRVRFLSGGFHTAPLPFRIRVVARVQLERVAHRLRRSGWEC